MENINTDALLQEWMLECYTARTSADGIERTGYIVPSMLPGFAWLQIWVSTGGAVLDSIRATRPVPTLEAARILRQYLPDLEGAELAHWPHPGCLQNPFSDELAETPYWVNGRGAH